MNSTEANYPATIEEWKRYHEQTAMPENAEKPLTLRELLTEEKR